MPVYFIDNDDFFMRRLEVCDEQGNEYPDNAERAIFYSRGVLETVKKMRWAPDVIHCQGWMSVASPLYIKRSYFEEPSYRDSRVIFTPSAMDVLKMSTTDQFRADIIFRNVTEEHLAAYPQHLSLRDLNHLAIDYSDGLLLTEESNDPELVEYAQQQGIPVLEPVDMKADGPERILEFYDQVERREIDEEEE
jgi:starch synthase